MRLHGVVLLHEAGVQSVYGYRDDAADTWAAQRNGGGV
jgi:hypothetical protein